MPVSAAASTTSAAVARRATTAAAQVPDPSRGGLTPKRFSQLKAFGEQIANDGFFRTRASAIDARILQSSVVVPFDKAGTASLVIPTGPMDPFKATDPNKASTFYVKLTWPRTNSGSQEFMGPFSLSSNGKSYEAPVESTQAYLRDLDARRTSILQSTAWYSESPAEGKKFRASYEKLQKDLGTFERKLSPVAQKLPEVRDAINRFRFDTWKKFNPGPEGYGPVGPAGGYGPNVVYPPGGQVGHAVVRYGFAPVYKANQAALGKALAYERMLPNGDVVQEFQNGSLLWNAERGVSVNLLKNGFATVYPQNRPALGAALDNEHAVTNGDIVQTFERGLLRWNPTSGVRLELS